MTKQIRLSCKYENGKLWWRGPDDNAIWFYRTRQEAEDIAQGFRESAKIYKWWAPEALEYARQMEAAIAEYDLVHTAHGPEVSAAEGTNSLPLTEKAA